MWPGYTKVELLELPILDFVGDVEKRWQTIGPFIHNLLGQYSNPKVLDLAMGSGQDSIQLIKEGYEVVSNEIDRVGISAALEYADNEDVMLNIRQVNWTEIESSSEYKPQEFDFIFSLGNSFPNYLLTREDRKRAMWGIWKILKPGGTLFFDTRNFDYMWENREEILKDPEHSFPYNYFTTYIGRKAISFPVRITDEGILLIHKNKEKKVYSELNLWLALEERVKEMIADVAPEAKVEIFYDYQKEKPEHYDFLQYIVRKPEEK